MFLTISDITDVDDIYTFAPGEVIEAGSYTDAIGQLYGLGATPNQGANDRYFERNITMGTIADIAQASLVAKHDSVTSDLPQEELDALLNFSRHIDIWAGREWTNECPLVVLADVYETENVIPTGNVIVVSAENEKTFVESAARVGMFHLEVMEELLDV